MNGQDLTKFCIHIIIARSALALCSIIFGKFATELRPLIDVGIRVLLNILRTFVYTESLSMLELLSVIFCKFATELLPLADVRIWFLFQS